MPWKPGESGNVLGGPKDKIVADSLRIAVLETIKSGKHKGSTKLRAIAGKVAEEALAGAPWAIQMIADRLDGRPLQQSETKVETNASELFLEVLRAMQAKPVEDAAKTIEHSTSGQDQPATEADAAATTSPAG
jgi:Family of unknown function (DUF5681)